MMPLVRVTSWTLAKRSLIGSEVELWWYGGPGRWTRLGMWLVHGVDLDGTLLVGSEFDGVRLVPSGSGYCIGRGLLV
jgi:hypothetical protein